MPITNAIRIIRFQLHVHRLNGIDHLVSARTKMSAIEDANIHCQKGTFEASSQNKVGGKKKKETTAAGYQHANVIAIIMKQTELIDLN